MENGALEKLIARARQALENNGTNDETARTSCARLLSTMPGKKGSLYPHLKVKYGMAAPLQSCGQWMMRSGINATPLQNKKITKKPMNGKQRLNAVLTNMEEMIYKVSNITFSHTAHSIRRRNGIHIYRDAKDYGERFGYPGE